MKRKIMPVIAAALATGTIFSGTAYAAPKDSQDVAYNVKAKGPNAEFVDQVKNQGQVNQLKSIDKQLDKIERILMEYKMKLNDIDEDDEDLDQDTDDVEDADQA
ncbi:hypothetical protein CD798_15655, partial [Bacillaceae bacterium SAOS 7]